MERSPRAWPRETASRLLHLPVAEGSSLPGAPHRGNGFIFFADLEAGAYGERFPSDAPLAVMTIYYRLKGSPGDAGALEFCEGMLERAQLRCTYSSGQHWDDAHVSHEFLPSSRTGGTLTVLEGPATRPDRPPEPPQAAVYPGPLTPEEVDFRVRVTGAVATPGEEVRIEVHASAAVEYSSILVPLDFDERYLRLARAESRFIGGVVLANNPGDTVPPGSGGEEGYAIVYSGSGVSSRRLAEEGEEVHAATLWFDVLEAAAEVPSTALSVETITDHRGASYPPWIGVRHAGAAGGDPVVRVEVEPIEITNGRVNIVGDVSYFVRGDSDRSGGVDITDPVATLNYLFLGSEAPRCMERRRRERRRQGRDLRPDRHAHVPLRWGGEAPAAPRGGPRPDAGRPDLRPPESVSAAAGAAGVFPDRGNAG